jgi:hypothetical protein
MKLSCIGALALAAALSLPGEVLPGAKVAHYIQVETKIRAIVRYELAAQIPLVQ